MREARENDGEDGDGPVGRLAMEEVEVGKVEVESHKSRFKNRKDKKWEE